jgi:ClpP class serine protease
LTKNDFTLIIWELAKKEREKKKRKKKKRKKEKRREKEKKIYIIYIKQII